MVVWLRTGAGASLRLGVVASRKVGNAVARNRARRLLREVFRRHRGECSGAFDVVIVARRSLLDARWPQIEQEFTDLARCGKLNNIISKVIGFFTRSNRVGNLERIRAVGIERFGAEHR